MKGPREVEGWVSVFRSGTDYEAELVRHRLVDAGLKAVVLTQRDHSFNLNHGDLAKVYVLVSKEQLDAARAVLTAAPLTDEELAAAALNADPADPPDGEDT